MSNKSIEDRLKTSHKRRSTLIPEKALINEITKKNENNIIPHQDDSATTSSKSLDEPKHDIAKPSIEKEISSLPETKPLEQDQMYQTLDQVSELQRRIGGLTEVEERSEQLNLTQTGFPNHNSSQTTSEPIPYRPRRYKKERLIDTHEQKSYYIEREIVSIIDELAGNDTGFKYRFVNEALRMLIYQEYPELVWRLRKKE
ncbi:hypothetical protein NDS46_31025 (plasmid) [Paenibacillus thiaminolyticus]|uniref:hypothetical protein n=1 Tax=Paenibacillus thiaminolyticus TaxID=49283 RepID=UPI00232BBEB0|nr:hypothetical protein [Paenibacillus thiaminolyticus]WCF11393.1 hypothetical protein NDS46_31025 [Paenibacillus thiaminolyticus]